MLEEMELPDDLRRLRSSRDRLFADVQAGNMTREDACATLDAMRVSDPHGRVWHITLDGAFSRHDPRTGEVIVDAAPDLFDKAGDSGGGWVSVAGEAEARGSVFDPTAAPDLASFEFARELADDATSAHGGGDGVRQSVAQRRDSKKRTRTSRSEPRAVKRLVAVLSRVGRRLPAAFAGRSLGENARRTLYVLIVVALCAAVFALAGRSAQPDPLVDNPANEDTSTQQSSVGTSETTPASAIPSPTVEEVTALLFQMRDPERRALFASTDINYERVNAFLNAAFWNGVAAAGGSWELGEISTRGARATVEVSFTGDEGLSFVMRLRLSYSDGAWLLREWPLTVG